MICRCSAVSHFCASKRRTTASKFIFSPSSWQMFANEKRESWPSFFKYQLVLTRSTKLSLIVVENNLSLLKFCNCITLLDVSNWLYLSLEIYFMFGFYLQLPEKKVAVEKTINSPKNDPIAVDDDSAVSEDQEEEELTEATTASNNPKMKRKRNRKRKIINSCEPESDKPDFKPYDYTKANFSRFVTSGQKNIKKLLSNKITFGASHKGVRN